MLYSAFLRWFCSRVPKENYDFGSVRSVLIRAGDAIGDAVLRTAAFDRIKTFFPNIKLGVVTEKRNAMIFHKCPLIDSFVDYSIMGALKNNGRWQLYFDCLDDFSSKGMLFQRIISPDYVISMYKLNKKPHYNMNNTHNYDFYFPSREGNRLRDSICMTPFFKGKNWDINKYRYVLSPCSESENPYKNIISDNINKKNILLCCEGTHKNRIIPINAFSDFLESFSHLPLKWVLLNTPRAPEYYDKVKDIKDLDIVLAPKTDFEGFYSFVYFADIVFSVDSAPVHIACAFDKPLISLYANIKWNIEQFKPIPRDDRIIIYPDKEAEDNHDFSAFTPDLIIKKAEPLLKKLCGIF